MIILILLDGNWFDWFDWFDNVKRDRIKNNYTVNC